MGLEEPCASAPQILRLRCSLRLRTALSAEKLSHTCGSCCLLGGGDPRGGSGRVQGKSQCIRALDSKGPAGGNLARDRGLIKYTGLARVYALP